MFVSALEIFKIGIGPSSSHTIGPMIAAHDFRNRMLDFVKKHRGMTDLRAQCVLRGSLAFTGKGHSTDTAVILGLHGYLPVKLTSADIPTLLQEVSAKPVLSLGEDTKVFFDAAVDVVFDYGEALPEHPNGMILTLKSPEGKVLLTETYFSIGGGFIKTLLEMNVKETATQAVNDSRPYKFLSAKVMIQLAEKDSVQIHQMQKANECAFKSDKELNAGLDAIWQAMKKCVENGLQAEGILPGKLRVKRRAKELYKKLENTTHHSVLLNEQLCAYAMSVNEENAAGHMVVTAPTNGAAGVVPAVLYYMYKHENADARAIRRFLLTASAICGLIKYRSSISGAEVGCQGEVGSASAIAAAGLCEFHGGSPRQIENAAEIALEHHLGMTCDPVAGLVQIPCIERNGFGAIKAVTAACLANRGDGEHFISLDSCIETMRQTGMDMLEKYKETSLGGLAVNYIEC